MPTAYLTPERFIVLAGEDWLRGVLLLSEGADLEADAKLILAVDSANSMADTYIRNRVALPLTASDGETFDAEFAWLINGLVDVAKYNVLGNRNDLDRRDATDRYDRVVKLLKDYAANRGGMDLTADNRAMSTAPILADITTRADDSSNPSIVPEWARSRY